MAAQPFDPPKDFLRQLENYDPLLRVRWSHKHGYWRIERKLGHGRSAVYDMTDPDDVRARSERHQVVLRVPYDCLDRQVLFALASGDIQRRGGYAKVAREMDEYEAATGKKLRNDTLDLIDQKSKARWTSWNTNYPITKYGRSYDHRAPGGRG